MQTRSDRSTDAAYDVLIVGGGPAGAATAIALARHGLTAAIVERHAAPPPRVGETLPPAVRNPLEALGVWQRFIDDGHDPAVGNRSSWGRPPGGPTAGQLDEIHFIRNAYGHGWHIDRAKFETMLLDTARDIGVTLFAGARIDSWRTDDSGGHIATLGDRQIRADFAVDASGRASFLARISGAERVVIDHLIASTMFLGGKRVSRPFSPPRGEKVPKADEGLCSDPQQKFTLIEAVEDGWWYSAPLPDGRLVVACMTDGDLDARFPLRDRDGWLAAAQRTHATRERIAAYSIPDVAPGIASANTSRLNSVIGPTWLAVGDAAVSFDPLSSQGIITALESALDAASAIAAGTEAALSRYASLVSTRYRDYLVERARYYGAEKRWPDSTFWHRRHLHLEVLANA